MTTPAPPADPPTAPAPAPVRTLSLCAVAVGAELAVVAGAAGGRPGGADLLPALFLIGPPVFLALLAWRRRACPEWSRTLSRLAVGVGAVGPVVFAALVYRAHADPRPGAGLVPLLVPFAEWVALLAAWLAMARAERRTRPPAGG